MTKKRTNCAKRLRPSVHPHDRAAPTLRFSPTAWAKLLYLRDYGETEVGAFGISADDDLLMIEEVRLVQQDTTFANVAFDDTSVADFFDEQVDVGRRLEQCGRIWIHTHPGDCPQPSFTDEETFDRVFGRADWAVMFILACGGQSYARLRFNVGPGAEVQVRVDVDYTRPFDACDEAQWEQEYLTHVRPQEQFFGPSPFQTSAAKSSLAENDLLDDWREGWFDYAVDDHPKRSPAS